MSVSDSGEIEHLTHDALVHLYDIPYLQKHPLTRWLAPSRSPESPGRVLRRLLLEAIQELKPPPDAPADTVATSRYQFLYLRYVRGEPIQRIASALSLSERQVYRRQRDALETAASILWQKCRALSGGVDATEEATPAESMRLDASTDKDVQIEVDRIATTPPHGSTDLLQVLDSTLATIKNLPRADARAIVLDVERNLPPVAIDRIVLRQAILGLLVFVLEIRDGEPRMVVSATEAAVCLSVRVHSSSGPSTLRLADDDSNLAVSKRLIELQGGTFTWQIADEVFEIVVRLPVDRHRTVLIVDDNQDTLHLFTRYLEGRAHQVLTASTGEEALRVVAEKHPDAVILDVMLPSADGWEILQSVRSHPDTDSIPVIVCTVLKQRDLALSLGATGFVPKPVSQGALLEALGRCWSLDR